MTIGDEKVVAWLLDSGGNRTYWADEETARKEYENLCVLGYRSDTTLTTLIPHSAYAELAADRDALDDRCVMLHGSAEHMRRRAEKAESQLAELRGRLEWLAKRRQDVYSAGEVAMRHSGRWMREEDYEHFSSELRTLAAADGGGG